MQIVGRKGAVSDVREDEHPRPETTLEQLAKLKAPFRRGGVITAGNASGVNDGAAALIIASEQQAAIGAHAAGAYRGDGDGGCRTAPDGTGAGTGGA